MAYTLITGASSGIGEACAKSFAELGNDLILVARRKEKLQELAIELNDKFGVDVRVFAVDVSDSADVEEMFEELRGTEIDVLVNNAGLALGKSSFEESDMSDLEGMIAVNVMGFTRVARLCVPFIKESAGHIFNISSIAGIESYEGGHVYCASKAFVKQMSKGLRIDLNGSGVRVTDVAPGLVETEFSVVRFHGDQEKADSCYMGYTPLYAKDIAACVIAAYGMPKSVNVEYMLVMPTAQASATRVAKG